MRLSLACSVVLTLALGAPARAHVGPNSTEVSFAGAIPCATVCAYWIDNGFAPCENPFPPGSWVDHVTAAAPERAPGRFVILEGTLDSEIDWDGFFCANDETRRELAQFASPFECDGPLFIPIACHEDGYTPVAAGQTVIFRAYNWSDAPPATGRYWFTVV